MNIYQRIILIITVVALLLCNWHFYAQYQAINQPEVQHAGSRFPIYITRLSDGYVTVTPIYYKVIFVDLTIIVSGLLLIWALKSKKKEQ